MLKIEEDLVAAIVEDVDAIEPRLVYGDFIQASGDPRGELAQLEVRLMHDEIRRRLEPIQAELLHGLPHHTIRRWWCGFVDHLVFNRRVVAHVAEVPDWLDHPALRAVREVDLDTAMTELWPLLSTWCHRASIRVVHAGGRDRPIDPLLLPRVVELFPRTRRLVIRSDSVPSLAAIRELSLESLKFEITSLEDVSPLVDEEWPIEHLAIHVRGEANPIDGLEPIFNGARMKSLRHLEIAGVHAREVVERLSRMSLERLTLPSIASST